MTTPACAVRGWNPPPPASRYSGIQIGQAFKPTEDAYNFFPFFRVMKALKMSLKPGRDGTAAVFGMTQVLVKHPTQTPGQARFDKARQLT
jgi:hypothetical protein